LLPLLGIGRLRKFGHFVGILVIGGLLGGVVYLTYQAIHDDNDGSGRADLFQGELRKSEKLGHRAVQLAHDGIPAEGAVYLLRRDPLTKGKELFAQNCVTCHSYGEDLPNAQATASDLAGFGTQDWAKGLLTDAGGLKYFGHTNLSTMSKWVERKRASEKKKGKEKEADLLADFDSIAAWLGSHPRKDKPKDDEQGDHAKGYRIFQKLECTSCHTYKGESEGGTPAPELTGYGDAEWLRMMVMSPSHSSRYGSRNAMPAFRDLDGPAADVTRQDFQQGKELLLKELENVPQEKKAEKEKEIESATKLINLNDVERELIIRYVLKDYRVIFGGEPVAAPAKP